MATKNSSPGEKRAPALTSDLRNRWLFIVPAVFITYSLAFLDRANYGFGAAAGLASTLQITKAQSALLAALFFLGYFLLQIPGASYARRKSATRLIFFSLICWGVLAALTGVIRNFWLLAADRLLLGMTESFVLPALLILLTHWFTREERSRTNTLLILGNPVTVLWMSAVTGFLIQAVGWQMAFILEGLPAVLWAAIWLAVVRDYPGDVGWLADSTKLELQRKLEREQSALRPVANVQTAFQHPQVLILCGQYFFWSTTVYALLLWLPTIIRDGSGDSIQVTGLLNMGPYLLAILLMTIVSYYSDLTLRRKKFIWPFLLAAGAFLFGSSFAIAHTFWLSYGFLILAVGAMQASYGPFFAMIPEMLPDSAAGEVMALVNSCGALGGFFGIWLTGLLAAHTGGSRTALLFLSIALTVAGLISLFFHDGNPVQGLPV